MMTGGQVIAFDVDAAGVLVGIDGPWDQFATRNGAPELTRASVLFRPFLSFVHGAEMRQLTAMLLTRVRSGAEVSLGFRCDAPAERRHLLLQGRADAGGIVRCTTTLLRTEPRPVPALLDPVAAHGGETLSVCGWCRRVRLEAARWVEVEEAVAALDLFTGEPVPLLTHGICPDCTSLMRTGSRRRFEL
jgi:hypothetical protein